MTKASITFKGQSEETGMGSLVTQSTLQTDGTHAWHI